jgi:hypothetical protein
MPLEIQQQEIEIISRHQDALEYDISYVDEINEVE